MGYKRDVIKGISWTGFLRFCTKLAGFIETLILARILAPQQFGAYGVALLMLGLLEVITETGVNVVLVQEENVDKHINSAWIVSILRGFIIMIILLISAPFIASFFRSSESLRILYLISLAPLLRGFINPAVVKFQKNLVFQKDFWYRLIILLVDTSVSITITYITKQPIGIVIGLLSGIAVELLLSFFIVSPKPKFQFEKEYINRMFHRGKWVTGSGVFNYLFYNADNIVVGRIIGTSALGIYQVAYSLSILPITEVADVFSRVTFPVFTKIAGDKKRLQVAFIKTILIVTLITLPFGMLLYFFPKEIITIILGKKWLAAVSILPVLAVFGVIRAISGSTSALFLSVGKQEYVTVVTLVSLFGLLVPIVPLVMFYGLIGGAISALIGSLIALPLMAYYTWKVFRISNN